MKPTIGRIVLFHPTPEVTQAAVIAFVHSDTMVNLAVFDGNGVVSGKTSVPLVNQGQTKPEFGQFCEWVPNQIAKQPDPVLFPIERQTADALVRIIQKIDAQIDGLG